VRCGHSFARIGAVLTMKVEDYDIQKRRGWVRLHEKAAFPQPESEVSLSRNKLFPQLGIEFGRRSHRIQGR
jgi:hypothetical protein